MHSYAQIHLQKLLHSKMIYIRHFPETTCENHQGKGSTHFNNKSKFSSLSITRNILPGTLLKTISLILAFLYPSTGAKRTIYFLEANMHAKNYHQKNFKKKTFNTASNNQNALHKFGPHTTQILALKCCRLSSKYNISLLTFWTMP